MLCCGASCPAFRARPPLWGVLGWALSLILCLGSWLRRRLGWSGVWYRDGLTRCCFCRCLDFLGCWFGPIPTYCSFSFFRGVVGLAFGTRAPRYWPICVVFRCGPSRALLLFVAEAVVAVPAFRLRGRSRPARLRFLVRSGSSCSVLCVVVGPSLSFCCALFPAVRASPRFPAPHRLGGLACALAPALSPSWPSVPRPWPSSFAVAFRAPPRRRPRPRLPSCLVVVCVVSGAWSAGGRVPGPPFLPTRARSLAPLAAPARSRSLPGLIWLGHSPGFSSGRRPAFGLSALRAFCRWGTARC